MNSIINLPYDNWRRNSLIDNDLYYYDAKAANRAVKFIETYCCHVRDRWAGMPFLLMDWQKVIVQDLIGWKRRSDNLRRFRELYLELPKGQGKSGLLTSIGMFLFLADGEAGATIVSGATNFQQANVTFGLAKMMIEESVKFKDMKDKETLDPQQFVIKGPKNSTWRIISGDGEGKAGDNPTCFIYDEIWEAPNRKLYDSVSRNAKKRSQPLILIATNSGTSKESICWELHERATRVVEGVSKDDELYPVIYGSDEAEDPYDEELWKRVNPALDQIITIETLRSEAKKAREVPALEAEFRRLHCGQWVQGTSKYIDMGQWDACSKGFSADDVAGLPLVLGLDMSLNDDLTALAFIYIGSNNLYAKCRFYLPHKTAQEYEQRDGIKFAEWSRSHIDLLDADTIDPQTQQDIANYIISLKDTNNLKALCYDRNRASNVIALVDASGIPCIPVAQNWELSPACEELTRRLKDKSIVLSASPVLRWNASNVEARTDNKGNVHLIKEARKCTYRGRRSQKIDGITALVTALTRVGIESREPIKKPSIYETRGVFSL